MLTRKELIHGDSIQDADHSRLNSFYFDTDFNASKNQLHDATLDALNKLGLYRFGCTGSSTSLILDDQKYIIAETTTSPSSHKRGRHTRDSGVDFGHDLRSRTYTFAPSASLSSSGERSNVVTIPNITADKGRLIIRDTAQDDDSKDYRCLLERPHMRFYAEVPLYSRSGHALGAYCIMDESPRAVFDDSEIKVLEEITASIANHLENVWDQQKHNRAAQMMNGLSEFVNAEKEAEYQSDSTNAGLSSAVSGVSLQPEQAGIVPAIDNLAVSTGVLDIGNSSRPSSREFRSKINRDRVYAESSRKASTLVSVPDVSVVSHQISTLFARASSLIRECLGVEGALFLDASPANARRFVFNNISLG